MTDVYDPEAVHVGDTVTATESKQKGEVTTVYGDTGGFVVEFEGGNEVEYLAREISLTGDYGHSYLVLDHCPHK